MEFQRAVSIGCELQSGLFPALPRFSREGLLSHLQVTIPSLFTYSEATDSISDFPLVVHCNLLNTLGDNHWPELRPWARQIRSLRPLHVIEHFTAFRKPSGEKVGVSFEQSMTRGLRRQKIIDTINQWQDILGVPLCMENIPIAENIEAYFDFFLDIKRQTGCGTACDLPHFYLSVFSAGFSDLKIRELALALDPVQLHVGGLSLSNDGLLRDNHKLLSKWILSKGRSHFPDVNFITLEQSHQISAEGVGKQLQAIQDCTKAPVPERYRAATGISADLVNAELTRDAARIYRYPEPIQSPEVLLDFSARHEQAPVTLLELYDKYLPFLSPISILESGITTTSAAESLKLAAVMSQRSLAFLSWWDTDLARTASCSVRYGEGASVLFERRFGAPHGQIEVSKFEKAYRFTSKGRFWVEVTSPIICMEECDQYEPIEEYHDRRSI